MLLSEVSSPNMSPNFLETKPNAFQLQSSSFDDIF